MTPVKVYRLTGSGVAETHKAATTLCWGKPLVNSGPNTNCGTLSVTGGFRRVRYSRQSGGWLIPSRAVGHGLPGYPPVLGPDPQCSK